jgi:hypothetical protein
LVALGFELRASRLLGLDPLLQPCFVMGFFEVGSCELFAQGCLLSSWDYRREPLVPGRMCFSLQPLPCLLLDSRPPKDMGDETPLKGVGGKGCPYPYSLLSRSCWVGASYPAPQCSPVAPSPILASCSIHS